LAFFISALGLRRAAAFPVRQPGSEQIGRSGDFLLAALKTTLLSLQHEGAAPVEIDTTKALLVVALLLHDAFEYIIVVLVSRVGSLGFL
jgi:hypothetical protein